MRIIYLVTAIVLLPVEIINFLVLYLYNAPESPLQSLHDLEVYGFQNM